jgi:CMP-N,N'-diacetyllegionaminic acid synthase
LFAAGGTVLEGMMCAIPARGGSKRLARKNVRDLAGKPLIAYSIEAAHEVGFNDVYVCTDDSEIAEVAVRCGALVPRLMPEELCGDLVASHIPCQFLASEISEGGRAFESLLCLQPSSPLRSADDIRGAVEVYRKGTFDFVVSVTAVDPHYFHWAVAPAGPLYWKMYFGTEYMKERPLLPVVCRPNGSIKIAKLSALGASGNFFGERLGVFETPEDRSVHVATEFDLTVCRAILSEKGAVASSTA